MEQSNTAEMIVILSSGLASPLRRKIRDRLESHGATVIPVEGEGRHYFQVSGEIAALQTLAIGHWPGVEKCVVVGQPSTHWAASTTSATRSVTVGSTIVGGGALTIIAGPCAVEDPQRTLRIAEAVADSGADLFRGGAFKPRTSPYAFQGLGEAALPILADVSRQHQLGIVTEVLDPREVERVSSVADMLQVGSRNMHNYSLLKELGQGMTPVLLKRGFASTIDELLMAAEYILGAGNPNVVLCERGIRCGAGTRNVVLDLGAIPELKKRCNLPVVVDPSHGSGEAYRVAALARAAAAAGADGILIEVHDRPEEALSDGRQALTPAQFSDLVPILRRLHSSATDFPGPDCEKFESQISDEIVGASSGEDR